MTKKQERFYWQLWAAVRRVEPDADRHELHRRAECSNTSHKDFTNEDFDRFKAVCLAITKPDDFDAQFDQVKMPAQRFRVAVDFARAALEVDENYLRAIADQMHLKQGAVFTLDSLSDADLKKLLIALKQAARRKWPTKDHLLMAVSTFIEAHYMPVDEVKRIFRQALCWPRLPQVSAMPYDALLTGLGALKKTMEPRAVY